MTEDQMHPEKNARMMILFSGKEVSLPPNCECPQSSAGKEFPYPERKLVDFPNSDRISDEEEPVMEEQRPGSSSAEYQKTRSNKDQGVIQRYDQIPLKLAQLPSQKQSHGYVLPHGRTWVRHKQPMVQQQNASPTIYKSISPNALVNKVKQINGNGTAQTPPINTAKTTTAQISKQHQQASITRPTQKRYTNMSLMIMKNGKRLYNGNRECYQFTENGNCMNGLFCIYEHNGSTEHMRIRVCHRLLMGLCRETDNCPNGSHSLQPHQMPVCDYYLRLVCSRGKEECPYLHVKHASNTDFCVDFNRGFCTQGIMCTHTHRYQPNLIRQKSSISSNTMNEIQSIAKHRQNGIIQQQQHASSSSSSTTMTWMA